MRKGNSRKPKRQPAKSQTSRGIRKLAAVETSGAYLTEIMQDLNNRMEEAGITSEDQIVSASVLPLSQPVPIHDTKYADKKATLQVAIVYWEND